LESTWAARGREENRTSIAANNEKMPASPEREESREAVGSIAEMLRLLSSGASGAILMALGRGPLRTKGLTERVPGYAPRTIYRYAAKLAEAGVVEREEQPGVPSRVVHRLTSSRGEDLYGLLDAFARAALTRLPSGEIDAHAWASLGLLGDLWESGLVDELRCEAHSPTELARVQNGLSYHQISRRANLFTANGLLRECPERGRRRYALTEKARRGMGLIAGLGRWRHEHVVPEGTPGIAANETVSVLRTALPLVRLETQAGRCIRLSVLRGDEPYGAEGESVWARVERDGTIDSCASPSPKPDAWARGKLPGWLATILDGRRSRMQLGGDVDLAEACLAQLYEALWAGGRPAGPSLQRNGERVRLPPAALLPRRDR